MAKREFLMLAHTYSPTKHGVGGWYVSEKLDGVRCFWDGGITTGMPKAVVPWANTAKDERYKETQYSTGLWSRYGNVIHAPKWWLHMLPRVPLDGELYLVGQKHRQDLTSIIKDLRPSEDWQDVRFFCFDMPAYEIIFADGVINNVNYKKSFTGIAEWAKKEATGKLSYIPKPTNEFDTTYKLMQKYLVRNTGETPIAIPHLQVRLSHSTVRAADELIERLDTVTGAGGEGLIVRSPYTYYRCERVHTLLKVKKFQDDEGIVVGYISGRKTDKGSKLLGMMGALILDYKGKRLELSGFTEDERAFQTHEMTEWAKEHPECEAPSWVHNETFPRGTKVTFRYRDLTKDGIPQEARYLRKHAEH